jgi:ribosomal protein S9
MKALDAARKAPPACALQLAAVRFVVNEKEGAAFFPRLGDLDDILRPFSAVGQEASKYDVIRIVNGGGTTGQTEAVRLGVPVRSRSSTQSGHPLSARRACSPAMPA